jgi:hypothetical protein
MKRLELYGNVVALPLVLGWAGCSEWNEWAIPEQDGGPQRTDAAADASAPVTLPESGDIAGEVLALTLVSWPSAESGGYIFDSHEILVLDETGAPWIPEIRTRTQRGSGRFAIRGLPADTLPSLHVIGQATGPSGSHDSVLLHYDRSAGMPFVALASNGTTQVAQTTSLVTNRPDRAALWGTIYWRPRGGVRQDSVGCALVALDGAPVGDDLGSGLRYVYDLLPTLEGDSMEIDQTVGGSRRSFYYGNIAPGPHTVRVSLDGGKSFVAESSFVIGRTRADALGVAREIAYDLAIDVEASSDPTPRDCPLSFARP